MTRCRETDMKRSSILLTILALAAGPAAIANDDSNEQVKRLPDLKVEDPVSEKPLQNADNQDLDAELRAILEEAEEAEQD